MSDPMKQAWSNVEQGLSTLGQMVKDHYRGVDGGEPDVDATAGGDQTPAPSSRVRSNGSWQPSATSVNGPPTWLATTTSRRRPGRRRRH